MVHLNQRQSHSTRFDFSQHGRAQISNELMRYDKYQNIGIFGRLDHVRHSSDVFRQLVTSQVLDILMCRVYDFRQLSTVDHFLVDVHGNIIIKGGQPLAIVSNDLCNGRPPETWNLNFYIFPIQYIIKKSKQCKVNLCYIMGVK